jgi:glutamate synthase (NADPH) small chain
MTDPRGFLQIQRRVAPYRPVEQRRADWGDVNGAADEGLVREQARRCMDCGVPFCHTGCPLGNLIPDWNDLVERGRWREAHEQLDATNNFPEFTGKLCPAPCEEACVLTLNDDPVTIKQVEMAISDRSFAEGWVVPRPPATESGRRVAVVGSGPAGLAAAQQLRRVGHAVTVFERDDRPGGLLRYGIPDFKLSKAMVDRRIEQLVAEGIEFRCNEAIDDVGALREAFDAVVLATGAQRHRDLALPGRDLAGIELAMPYLISSNRRCAGLEAGPVVATGLRVAILGGGDTSADCLGSAHREGCASVVEVAHGVEPPSERSPLQTWPRWPRLRRSYAAHLEGGERRYAYETVEFLGRDGRVTGLRDAAGAEIEVDLVLIAVGFTGVEADLGVDLTPRSTVQVDETFATTLPGVFAAGDCVRGADLIVSAIADGRECARAVDRFLTGSTALAFRDRPTLVHSNDV